MHRLISICSLLICLTLLSGCWSSKEIEERSVYVGMAIDVAEESPDEKQLIAQGGATPVEQILTATIQIVPVKSVQGGKQGGESSGETKKYLNDIQTGDSIFEVLRAYALRRDRAVIGHHLKVIVISTKLAEKVEIENLLDFMLRDNDIRPSCMIFLSRSKAEEALYSNQPDEIPAFHIVDMVRNKFRNNKIMNAMTLTTLDQYMHSKQSYILQNIAATKGETEFSGAGIIKGSTGKWIGNLDQEDVSSIAWILGESAGGLIKTKNEKDKTIIYEIKSVKSKIKPKVDGTDISFHVDIKTEGRLIETWSSDRDSSEMPVLLEAQDAFVNKLDESLQITINKLQQKYKVDVAGFGKRLRITHPQVWKRVKDDWDEIFSRSKVTYSIDLKITDYGSSAE